MEWEQTCFIELMKMVNEFSGYTIDSNHFSMMVDSPLIMEPLSCIYSLHRSRQLSSNDTQEIKKKFHNNFIFFSEENTKQAEEKYSYKKLFLLFAFFALSLTLGIGCFYLPPIFIPLICFFLVVWFVNYCIIKKNNPLNLETHNKFSDELLRLKYELNLLKNTLVDNYSILKIDNRANNHDSIGHYSIEETPCQKKKVTFSYITKINLFSENFDSSSSVNFEEVEVAPQL